jgi:Uma2 family endonuclease
MIQTLNTLETVDFDQFIAWYPEKAGCYYELHQGVIVEMPKPKGKHSQIAGFLMTELGIEIRRLNLPYFVPRECIINGNDLSGYEPDVIVLEVNQIKNELRWEKESTIIQGESIALVIEVVSSNWSDDYALKFDVYEELKIKEYWIIDYLGLGGRKFIGSPKQPTITINQLVAGEYQSRQFRGGERLISPIFNQLNLTANQVFEGI